MRINFNKKTTACILFIILSSLAVYWQITNHEFINFDDDLYITNNPMVKNGITAEGISWAFEFNDKHGYYWRPLTWISHMADVELFGLDAGHHHLVSLILHICASLLIFISFRQMTGRHWESFFVACLFALHPVNVDSVAWAAERNNVLSTNFWLLTILAYGRYAKKPNFTWYVIMCIAYGLGILSKPMLVTLPCVLLLLDYWPLGRFTWSGPEISGKHDRFQKSGPLLLIAEKIPLLLFSLIIAGVVSRSIAHTIIPFETVPLGLRLENAAVSYIAYLGKIIWPVNLSVFYPYPTAIDAWQPVGAACLLVIITVSAIKLWKKAPYFIIGWLWYLGVLFPVIGLVQQGLWPAMADRWLYVPSLGIFIIFAWGVPRLAGKQPYGKLLMRAGALFIILACTIATYVQAGYWKNSLVLFQHALKTNPDNFLAHYKIGTILSNTGNKKDALKHFYQSIKINPHNEKPYINLGTALIRLGRYEEAAKYLATAVEINDRSVDALNNLGNALVHQQKISEAMDFFKKALTLDPDHAATHVNMGLAYEKMGQTENAITAYSAALQSEPANVSANNNMGNVLARMDRNIEAIRHFNTALAISPQNSEAHNNLGNALVAEKKYDEALTHYELALTANPGNASIYKNMALVFAAKSEYEKALYHFNEALKTHPDDPQGPCQSGTGKKSSEKSQCRNHILPSADKKQSPKPDFTLSAREPLLSNKIV